MSTPHRVRTEGVCFGASGAVSGVESRGLDFRSLVVSSSCEFSSNNCSPDGVTSIGGRETFLAPVPLIR
jgi:hypothetical protein